MVLTQPHLQCCHCCFRPLLSRNLNLYPETFTLEPVPACLTISFCMFTLLINHWTFPSCLDCLRLSPPPSPAYYCWLLTTVETPKYLKCWKIYVAGILWYNVSQVVLLSKLPDKIIVFHQAKQQICLHSELKSKTSPSLTYSRSPHKTLPHTQMSRGSHIKSVVQMKQNSFWCQQREYYCSNTESCRSSERSPLCCRFPLFISLSARATISKSQKMKAINYLRVALELAYSICVCVCNCARWIANDKTPKPVACKLSETTTDFKRWLSEQKSQRVFRHDSSAIDPTALLNKALWYSHFKKANMLSSRVWSQLMVFD